MSERLVRAVRTADVAPGGMKAIDVNGRDIVVCNAGGTFYAMARRCGHMNAPLERGTLVGTIVTCPMHCAQFDVSTGEALSGPVPVFVTDEVPPRRIAAFLRNAAALMPHIRTESIATFRVNVEDGWVWIADDDALHNS